MTQPPALPTDIELLALTPDLRALADIRLLRLEDGPGRGQRLLIARNAAGVGFEVAVDRGFDVCALSLDQIQLGWHSQNRLRFPPVAPDSDGGYGFLRNFDGFLVTCGLDYYGPPREADGDTTVSPHQPRRRLPQHGEIAAAPGRLVGYGLDATTGELWCEGVVRQSSVFGHVLERHRRITLALRGLTLSIADRVTNLGFNPAPHALLYHINFGYPLLDRTSVLTGAFGSFGSRFAELPPVPSADVREIVDHLTLPADAGGDLRVGIRNPALAGGIGVDLTYPQRQLPSLLVWRSYQSGVFALGIEPGTTLPRIEGDRLVTGSLGPRASAEYEIDITISRGL